MEEEGLVWFYAVRGPNESQATCLESELSCLLPTARHRRGRKKRDKKEGSGGQKVINDRTGRSGPPWAICSERAPA